MNNLIYLRALHQDDAKTSYAWRNNPLIWEFTKFRAARHITFEIESAWIKNVINKDNEYRFAICMKEDGRYIGNVQLIDLKEHSAEFHLFIGDVSYWGKGIGKEATDLILQYGFINLGLKFIYLQVHRENLPAMSIYKKIGFVVVNNTEEFIDMEIQRESYQTVIIPNDLSDVSAA
ncbi:GCN5-related N-acetyltransferase [Arcticibacter svalbardensis MN12-7]|uniref:GCN5-related N-acetyltransferase n=1 Tax=Arcticibacter svalbardensis MN12-7 TaxID=1150600 RepID=R9GQ54_9SPHI|nr:GNAT family N-acetyltransferase [Arcticibacter svalbardensis]EOR93848.1 GCN5-related N-acetyltransferase [Arcticibacter svalbardensis MN12-7]